MKEKDMYRESLDYIQIKLQDILGIVTSNDIDNVSA